MTQNAPTRVRHLVLFAFVVGTLMSAACFAQTPFQRRAIPSISAGSFNSVIYGCFVDSTATLFTNSGIIEVNLNSGTVGGGKKVNANGKPANFSTGCRVGSSIFLAGTPGATGAEYDTTWLFKYDLASGNFLWAKAFNFPTSPARFTSTSADEAGALYLAGESFDTTSLANVVLMKVDTNGVVNWSKSLVGNSDFVSKPQITYVREREIYLSYINWYSSVYGNANTVRIDSAGNILAHGSIMNPSGAPRFADCYATIVNGALCTLYPTYQGPSDGGPMLVRIIDTLCTTIISKTISGLQGRSVTADAGTIVLSGQGYVTYGVPGFRTVRFDTALNVIATNHFHKIPTYSISSSVYSMLLPGGNVIHCFRHGSDSLHIMLADTAEKTHCREIDFTPGATPSVLFSSVPYTYSFSSFPYTVTTMTPSAISTNELSVYADDECALPDMITETQPVATHLSVFPNPATDILNLPKNTGWVAIYSTDGRLALTQTSCSTVDISTLPAGLYFIKLHMKDGETTLRFSKL
ncbi:MAG: T9SS type A sorting domain-containing protein [Taibaiella sp.]|nr:T9SS type A sorting domain-containing protein [Taibaiella sp.]